MPKHFQKWKTYIDHINKKKKTRATIAKAKGLEPLAQIIFEQNDKRNIEEIAKRIYR